MRDRMTTAQRQTLVGLLRRSERYDLRTVTFMHRQLGVSEALIGVSVDEWLDTLTVSAASAVIDILQREVRDATRSSSATRSGWKR